MPGHSNRVQCIRFHPLQDNLFFSSGWDATVYLYDTRRFMPVTFFSGPQVSGESLDVRAQDGGHVLLVGGYEATDCLQFWDMRKTQDGPFQILDWCGGFKDGQK